jgi:hypothetical protein
VSCSLFFVVEGVWAAATEIAPMAEANSLLIRCEYSRSSRRASEEDRFDDGISINCIMMPNPTSDEDAAKIGRVTPVSRRNAALTELVSPKPTLTPMRVTEG